jgi:hypothetical protein
MAPPNTWSELDRFLLTDPRDVGCGEAAEIMDAFAEYAATDPVGAGRRYPEVAAHLRACQPCALDVEGLLVQLRDATAPPTGGNLGP